MTTYLLALCRLEAKVKLLPQKPPLHGFLKQSTGKFSS